MVIARSRRFVSWRHGWHNRGYPLFGLEKNLCLLVVCYNIIYFPLYILLLFHSFLKLNPFKRSCLVFFFHFSYYSILFYSLSQNPDHKLIQWLCCSSSPSQLGTGNYSTSDGRQSAAATLFTADHQHNSTLCEEQHMEL